MRRAAAAAVVLLLPLIGCGGSNESGTRASATTGTTSSSATPVADEASRIELERAVRSYSAAYVDGDADSAIALLSNRCRQRLGSQVPEAVRAAKDAYRDARITSVSIDDQSGDQARVTYRFNRPELDQEQEPWVRENGQWRVDDC